MRHRRSLLSNVPGRKANRAIAELDSLDSAVASLKAEADSLKKAETALPAIKTKYRGHPEQ